MTRLLIATTNPAKLAEYRLLLRELPLDLVSLGDVGITETPLENGASFAENALIKAHFYFARSRMPTLADDGGLEIEALGGEPGVRSHRWLGETASDDESLVKEVIRRMTGVESGRRAARIKAAVALIYRDAGGVQERTAEAALDGIIADRAYPSIRPGFPYRSVLFIPALARYVVELGEEQEAAISQRKVALKKLSGWLGELAL
jgi:XTP/dITP diphosphohydrolase